MTRPDDELLALALSRPREALATARSLLAEGVPPAVAAVAHQAAGIVLRDFGDIDEALAEFRAGLRCARRAADAERTADVRSAYGLALVMAGRSRHGLRHLEAAASDAAGEAEGRIRIREAHALWILGHYTPMLRAAQRAVDVLAGGGAIWEARALSHRAMANLALGNVTRAESDYERAETLFARAGQRLEYAAARHDRGAAAFARGDLPAALALLDDAQQLVDLLGVFEPDLVVTRVQVLLAAELRIEARRVADDGVARSVRQGGAPTRRGELLLVAALAAYAAGDQRVAAERSAEASRLFRRQRRPWWAARADLVLLESWFNAGPPTLRLLRAAALLATRLETVDPARAPEAHLLAGRIGLALGRRRAALTHLRAAASRRRLHDLRGRAAAWLARALLAEQEGRYRDMLVACERGLDILDARLATLGATELRARVTAQGGDFSRLALRYAVRSGDGGRVLRWSERWRATALALPPMRLPADAEMTRDLVALRTLSLRLLAADPQSPAVSALLQERRRLEAAVRRQSLRRRGHAPDRPRPLHLGELSGLLDEVDLVELTTVDGDLFAVHVPAGRRPTLHRVGPVAAAERAVAHALFALRREESGRGGGPLDLIGRRLQDALLGSLAGLLTAPLLVVVPTGRLHAVPWALMPALRERAVTVSPSARVWRRSMLTTHDGDHRVVLVGGPGLTGGAVEIQRLARRYPDAEVLADGLATSDRVLAAMDGAWLVHVAAHGTFRADSPLLSALELDDGPLTVYDLERLGRAPHRVVLSSCNSAVGAPSGADELLGVASAFVGLGTAGLVASVVPIDDPASVPFMLALHDHIERMPLGPALAAARRSVRPTAAAHNVALSFITLGA